MAYQLVILAAIQGVIAIWLFLLDVRMCRLERQQEEADQLLWREISEWTRTTARVQDLERR